MTELFTDTVLNMMTTTAEPEDYTGRTVCFTAASAARRKKPTFPKKPPHGWGMTSTQQNVTANGRSVWNVNPPRNADDTLTPLWN